MTNDMNIDYENLEKLINYNIMKGSDAITILGSTFYCIGGLLTLKLKNKKNENVTTSTTLWSVIFLLPFSLFIKEST